MQIIELKYGDEQQMKPFRFIHSADLHLDSPFKGISEVSDVVCKQLAEATFISFNNIIDLCIEKDVDFLLIAGDIYDGEDKSLRAQLRFRDGLRVLSGKGIDTFIVHGNHDPLKGWSANLEWPERVHIFGGKNVEEIDEKKDGETICKVCGISYLKKDTQTNLSTKFPTKSNTDPFTIGLLHCNLGSDTGHDPYAPCTLDDLIDHNFDYWALGHIHKRSEVNEDPLIIYSGNPQGRNPREDGIKGCYLVEVESDGSIDTNFLPTDTVRWYVKEIDINDMKTEDDLITALFTLIEDVCADNDEISSICRVILTGRGLLHSRLARKGVLDDILLRLHEEEEISSPFVWIESIKDRTSSEIDRDGLMRRKDFIGDMLKIYEDYYSLRVPVDELKESLEPLFQSHGGRKNLKDYDKDELIELLKKAEAFCLSKLQGEDRNEV